MSIPYQQKNNRLQIMNPFFPLSKQRWNGKLVVGFILICGVGLTIWGGYGISKRVKKNNDIIISETALPEMKPVTDSAAIKKDSIIVQSVPPADTNYKYVLEVAKSKRAFKRYNQLKDIDWNVTLKQQTPFNINSTCFCRFLIRAKHLIHLIC